MGFPEVVLDVERDENHQGEDEQRTHEVVQVLRDHSERGERCVAHDRQDDVLAEEDHDAGKRQHDEGKPHRPVRHPLHAREAFDEPPRQRVVRPDGPLGEVEEHEDRERDEEDDPAVERDRPVAQLNLTTNLRSRLKWQANR